MVFMIVTVMRSCYPEMEMAGFVRPLLAKV